MASDKLNLSEILRLLDGDDPELRRELARRALARLGEVTGKPVDPSDLLPPPPADPAGEPPSGRRSRPAAGGPLPPPPTPRRTAAPRPRSWTASSSSLPTSA